MSDKIRKYVLPNLPYLFVFWFFSKIGTAYRIAPGTDFGTKLMGMLDTFPKAFETYWPGLGGIDLLVGLAGAAGVYLLIQSKIRQAKKFRRDAEYGTARFGTKEDIKPFVDPKFQNNVILTGTEFLTMNTRPKIPANARNLNACVIGSSGSGKTRFWLTPQLLQAHSSYVVVDPKGGTLSQCGYFLQKKKGYKVKVFNSVDFSKSMHYNPMAYIKTESDVLKFVNALIANTKGDGKEGDEFWTKAETLLYCALVAYIVFEGPEEERNMNTLVEMINSMEVREDDESFKNAVDYMFDGLAKRSPQHFAVRQYAKYKLASGKTAKSILISCGARLAPFDIAELREIMSYDELELDKLGDEKTALFFLISDTDSTYNFIVALAFSQMFNLLCERADNKYGGRLPHHVRVLWDEAAGTVEMHLHKEPRFYASVGYDRGTYRFNGGKMTIKAHKGEPQGFTGSYDNEYQSYNGYFCQKWVNEQSKMTLNSSGNYSVSTYMSYVFPYMRIAELYLSYAEADFEYDGTLSDYGYECLNKIRSRCGLPTFQESWSRAGGIPSGQKLRDIIRRERSIEFLMEGRRFHDIRRWKIAEECLRPIPKAWNIEGDTPEKFYKLVDMKENDTRIFTTPKHYWLAIPNSQLNINGQLVQNPGY